MERKFIVDEIELRDMLAAQIENTIKDYYEHYSDQPWDECYYLAIQDFYPELISVDELQEKEITIDECVGALLEAGRFQELVDNTELIKNLSGLLDEQSLF